jgi:hypothetical protein
MCVGSVGVVGSAFGGAEVQDFARIRGLAVERLFGAKKRGSEGSRTNGKTGEKQAGEEKKQRWGGLVQEKCVNCQCTCKHKKEIECVYSNDRTRNLKREKQNVIEHAVHRSRVCVCRSGQLSDDVVARNEASLRLTARAACSRCRFVRSSLRDGVVRRMVT